MRDIYSFYLIAAVFVLFFTRTHSKELQSNDLTSTCKPDLHSGMPGVPGVPGIPGTPGALGRDGFKGEKGSIGKRGSPGAVGIPGKIGPRGPEGFKGEVGKKGEIGNMGAKGSAGNPGNTGPRGFKGSKGDKGLMGIKGRTGIGIKGQKGDGANMDPRERANWKQCAWKRQDNIDNGKIQECSFNKLHDNTALRVSFQGTVKVYATGKCNRWFFKFNGNECSGPLPIDSIVYNRWAGGLSDIQRIHFIEGYCENLARGTVSVEVWVGKCSGFTLGDAMTGWNSVSRIMIEEVPPSQ